MSRITDYILEPKVVYTEGGFLVRVKVIDDYKYKKYLISENLHYKTVQGTSFTLTDADSSKKAEITEIRGNTTQEGTPTPSNPIEVQTVSGDNNIVVSGKNFWNSLEDQTVTTNKEVVAEHFTIKQRYSYNKVLNITNNELSGKPSENTGNYYLWDFTIKGLKPNTTYTLSYKIDMSGVTGTASATYFFGETISIENMTGRQRTLTFTTDENGDRNVGTSDAQKRLITLPINQTDLTFRIYDIQLEQGTTATTYEPYKGNSYRVDLGGKNKISKTNWELGSISGNPLGENIPATNRIRNINYIKVQPDTKYTLSLDNDTTTTAYVFEYNSSKRATVRTPSTWTTTPYTFTTRSDTGYVRIIFATTSLDIGTIAQLEKGENATSYTEYNPIELCKIGNYQDRLYYDSGKWYIEKNTRSLSLKISDMNNSNDYPGWKNQMQLKEDYPNKNGALYNYCNFLSNIQEPNVAGVSINTTGTGGALWLSKATYNLTQNEWKANYPNLTFILYYNLATPTYTEITDTYLLTQLQALENIELYENLCYLDWVGSVKAEMSLQYATTEDFGTKYIVTENGTKIRTDWRKLGRRKYGR